MADYWKSTPKYWCKFCEIFVRDTKNERQQHEATGKHQGAIQRSLRDLHRAKEREDREKQRAKDEVARLTGIVSGNPASSSTDKAKGVPRPQNVEPRKKTVEEAQRDLAQLAAMGVAIPEELRGGLALVGEWKTVAKPREPATNKGEDGTAGTALNVGVRKRKAEDEDEEALEQALTKRKGWGHTFKTLGDDDDAPEEDLEALFPAKKIKKDPEADLVKTEAVSEGEVAVKPEPTEEPGIPDSKPSDPVKTEPDTALDEKVIKSEPGASEVVFKKRKNKVAKPK